MKVIEGDVETSQADGLKSVARWFINAAVVKIKNVEMGNTSSANTTSPSSVNNTTFVLYVILAWFLTSVRPKHLNQLTAKLWKKFHSLYVLGMYSRDQKAVHVQRCAGTLLTYFCEFSIT